MCPGRSTHLASICVGSLLTAACLTLRQHRRRAAPSAARTGLHGYVARAAASSPAFELDASFGTLEDTRQLVQARGWPNDRSLPVRDFLHRQRHWLVDACAPVVFDVRSPIEFDAGHTPGAINLPLLTNDQRETVGKTFRHDGPNSAFSLAIQQVYPNLAHMLWQAVEVCDATSDGHVPRRHVLVYCKRGGMRSQSMATFLTSHGFEVYTLSGGYKAFRTWAMEELQRPQKVCVVAGATGSGKTEVLQALRQHPGRQVVDLEALACHKGSVFGHLGEQPQPTSEHFRNLLACEWAELDPERFVFLEDEGPRIGEVCLPAPTYSCIRAAHLVVHLDVPFAMRADRSLATYGPYGADALSESVERFRVSMGNQRTDELLRHLADGELRPVCEEALRNYDKIYEHHLRKNRNPDDIVAITVDTLDSAVVANAVETAAATRETLVSAESMDRAASADDGLAGGVGDLPCREALCHCGAVSIKTWGAPIFVSICHCSVCRRLSGAPFVASALFAPAHVELRGGGSGAEAAVLVETQTSPSVARRRCAACYSPVCATLGSRYLAVPLSLFGGGKEPLPSEWRPQHHLHYGMRVLDVEDGLPKYEGRVRGPMADGGQRATTGP